jgi:hypothetical protein
MLQFKIPAATKFINNPYKEASMKKGVALILATIFILSFGLAAQAIHETIPSETQATLPGPDAAKLYEYIMKSKPYADWQLFPGKGRMYEGKQPHGAFLTTYVNSEANFSIKDKKGMADDSIIVKENYTADKKLNSVTVMYKIKGYNPAAGDWFWAKYGTDGKVLASGRVNACITCHEAKKDNDYIFSGKIMN